MEENVYKIAIAAFLHDIGKFAERGGMSLSPTYFNNNADLYLPFNKSQGRHTHKHALYTAAFIEEFGKLLPPEFNRRDWGFEESFVNLAAGHHRPESPYQWIITVADRISSGFDRSEFDEYNREIGVREYKRTRLLTIFEGIGRGEEDEREGLDTYRYRYPLKELTPENIFPAERDEFRTIDDEKVAEEYRSLFFNFVDALERLHHRETLPLWFEHFDSLLMIYASHIPAATVGRVVPDVSLYDHSRITSAIATALYLYHSATDSMEIKAINDEKTKKFLLITGDLYGIQDFIFSTGGATGRNSAKLLRGRSFLVSLFVDLAADMVCRALGLPFVSTVLNAAGKFTVIAPNTEEALERLKETEREINDWFVRQFYGETTIGISYVEAAPEDFTQERFPTLWERLQRGLERKKCSKIDLEEYGGVIEGYLDGFDNTLTRRLCPFCGKRPSSRDVEGDSYLGAERSSCRICRDTIYIGTKLVKESRIAITTPDADIHGDKLTEPVFGRYQVSFDVGGRLSNLAKSGALLRYWDISIPRDGGVSKEITAKFINGYIPYYPEDDEEMLDRLNATKKSERSKEELFDGLAEGRPKTFHALALMALNRKGPEEFTGLEAIGVLKADVDNLGFMFSCGLRRQSLSRLATLSRQMNNFFSLFLPYVLSTEKRFQDIYTLFAGGDDLFFVGPWNKIIDFGLFMYERFRQYTCHNDIITISAGITIHKPDEPVRRFSEHVEEALAEAKGAEGKDSLSLFGERIKWSEFEELKGIENRLEEWLDKGVINNAMLYRLNSIIEMIRRARSAETSFSAGEDVDMDQLASLKWRALLKYTLVRNVARDRDREEREKALKEVEVVAKWLVRYGTAFKLPLWQILYNNRRG